MSRALVCCVVLGLVLPATGWSSSCLDVNWIGLTSFGRSDTTEGGLNVAANSYGLVVFDLSVPANPRLVGSVLYEFRRDSTTATPSDVVVVGNHAYALTTSGVLVYDLADPEHPAEAGVWPSGGAHLTQVAAGAGTLYLCSRDEAHTSSDDDEDALIVLDLSEPERPAEIARLGTTGGFGALASIGQRLCVSDGSLLRFFDVSKPAHPVEVAVIDTGVQPWQSVASYGSFLYCSGASGLVIDLAIPDRPVVVGPGPTGSHLAVDGDTLYSWSDNWYLRRFVIDVWRLDHPNHPAHLSSVEVDWPDHDYPSRLSAANGVVTVDGGGRVVIDARDPASPSVVRVEPEGPASYAVTRNGAIFVAGTDASYLVALDQATGTVLGSVRWPGVVWSRGLALDGDLALLANGSRGLDLVDVRDPRAMSRVGEYHQQHHRVASGVAASPGRAYLLLDDAMEIVDTSVPEAPTLLGRYDGRVLRDLEVAGELGFAVRLDGTLAVLDLTHPAGVSTLTTLDVGWPIWALDLAGNLLILACSGGICLVDVTDPLTPTPLSEIYVRGAYNVVLGENYAYAHVTRGWQSDSGLAVIALADPTAPYVSAWSFSLTTPLAAVSDTAYVKTMQGGMASFDPLPCADAEPALLFKTNPGESLEVGETIRFSPIYYGQVDSWAWDFGDGSVSNESSPSHVFSRAGSTRVDLTATGPGGQASVSRALWISPESSGSPPIASPRAHVRAVGAAAHLRGVDQTLWTTDLVLHNPAETPVAADLYLLPRDQDNSMAAGLPFTVGPDASLTLSDVVTDFFGEAPAVGSLLVAADGPLVVSSRTATPGPPSLEGIGTYGQLVPGQTVSRQALSQQGSVLLQLVENSSYRTNLGLSNPTADPVTVMVDVHLLDGTWLGRRTHTLPAFGNVQETSFLGFVTRRAVDAAYARITTSDPGAPLVAYASVVDSGTGDPTYVLPAQPGADVQYLLGAAHLPGVGGTAWRSDAMVCNPEDGAAEVRLDLLLDGSPPGDLVSQTITLPPRSGLMLRDLVASVFGAEGKGVLRVVPQAGRVAVSGRTYTSGTRGTRGQLLPAMTASDMISGGTEGRLVQLVAATGKTWGFRTNLGLFSESATTVEVRLARSDGSVLGNLDVALDAGEFVQLGDVFGRVTDRDVPEGYAVVRTSSPGGGFLAYASVIDNESGDPVLIPAAVLESAVR